MPIRPITGQFKIQEKSRMELTPNLHAFLWTSVHANNCNSYLLRSPEKNILIDPGHINHFDHVRDGLNHLGLSLNDIDLIICTHAHPDHMEAVTLFSEGSTQIALHEGDWKLVQKMAPFLENTLNFDLDRYRPDFYLTEGVLTVGDIALDIHHTPGHSPGGVTLHWRAEKALFTGDLIFAGGLGRTDLPGGDGRQLKESIRKIATVKAQWFLSGHGDILSDPAVIKSNFDQVEQTWFGYL